MTRHVGWIVAGIILYAHVLFSIGAYKKHKEMEATVKELSRRLEMVHGENGGFVKSNWESNYVAIVTSSNLLIIPRSQLSNYTTNPTN